MSIEKTFYIKNQCLKIKHNTITGTKIITLNGLTILATKSYYLECKNSHDLYIDDTMYRLVVTPKFFGGFKYAIEDLQGLDVSLFQGGGENSSDL
jgi:hypothetical protein